MLLIISIIIVCVFRFRNDLSGFQSFEFQIAPPGVCCDLAMEAANGLGLLQARANMSPYQGLVGGSSPQHQQQSDARRLFNGWNYQGSEPPLPPPIPQRSSGGCGGNFSPYTSTLHGPGAGASGLHPGPYGSFGSSADFLQHQFGQLNQLNTINPLQAPHRNLSFYPDLYGHHQPSPAAAAAAAAGLNGRSLLTDLSMPPRFDADPLSNYINDVGNHNSGEDTSPSSSIHLTLSPYSTLGNCLSRLFIFCSSCLAISFHVCDCIPLVGTKGNVWYIPFKVCQYSFGMFNH